MKRALIAGVSGQDGACLTECPPGKCYEVHGIKRSASSLDTDRGDDL